MNGSRLAISVSLWLFASAARAGDCSVLAVDGGTSHSVAVDGGGSVWAWGSNRSGELGNGGINDSSSVPSLVSGLTGVAFVSAGGGYRPPANLGGYSVAIGVDGRVWSWGNNSRGQLGDGSTNTATVPTEIALASPALTAAAGGAHSLLVMLDGTMRAMGDNSQGQLGDGTPYDAPTPIIVAGVSSAVACAAGDLHSLALLADGTVLSWGSNDAGQLGDTVVARSTPGPIPGLVNVVAIAAGLRHSLALLADGNLLSWGSNDYAQLGRGGNTTVPDLVPSFGNVVAIAAGSSHSLAVTADGNLWAWGENQEGQTANNVRNLQTTVPTRIEGIGNAAVVGAGDVHSLAAGDDGTVWGFGANYSGQLGDGYEEVVPFPRRQTAGGFSSVSGRASLRVALLVDGTVATWGNGDFGELGFGYLPILNVRPRQVPSLSGVAQVVAGSTHALALLTDGSLYGWGHNTSGQLGDGTTTDRTAPTAITGVPPMLKVSVGSYFSLAVLFDGSVVAWGSNSAGQLGNNSTTDSSTPVASPGPTGVTAIGAGSSHALAVDASGRVWAWGLGSSGQRGDGTTTDSHVPERIPGLDRAIAVAATDSTSAVLRDDGTVWTFGSNSYGELGIGSATPSRSATPVMVPALDRVVAIGSGTRQFYALRDDGTTLAWGSNFEGQLGDGTTTSRSSPQPVLVPHAVALATSGPAIIDASGHIWSWGQNRYGEMGIGTARRVPEALPNLLRELRDPPPPDQGNVLFAVRDGANVRLTFPGAAAYAWRVLAGPSKLAIGQSPLSPDATIPEHLDIGAVSNASDFYYAVRGLTACGNLGPRFH